MGPASPTATPTPSRVLLVDDEPNILTALRRLLRREPYEVVTECDAQQALQRLETEDFDVIVSDQRMPSMTGVEFLRQAKRLRPQSKRIVLSGYTDLDSVTAAINEGAIYKFLTKPWDDEQLRQHIADALRHKQMEDENQRMAAELQRINERHVALNTQLAEVIHQQRNHLHRDESVMGTLQAILHQLPMPLLGCDNEGMVVYCNAAAEDLFSGGHASVPLLGSDLGVLWPDQPGGAVPWRVTGLRLSDQVYTVECRPLDAAQPSRGRLYLFHPA